MRPAYMCGENLPEYDKPEFRSMGDTIFELKTGGYYFEGWREEKMNKYIIPLAVIILFIFFLVLVPNFLGVVI
jgi:hypothetical protein